MFRRTRPGSRQPEPALAAQTPAANPIDFIDAFRAPERRTQRCPQGARQGVCAEGEFVASELAHQRFAGPLFSGQAIRPNCASRWRAAIRAFPTTPARRAAWQPSSSCRTAACTTSPR
jgi:hypothetical protein